MHLYVFLFTILVSVILLQTQVEAQAAIEVVRPHPAYPGKCYHAKTRTAHSPGQTWNDQSECLQYRCGRRNNGYTIQTTGCGLVQFRPGCRIIENKRATYPNCCPKLVCNGR